MKRDDIIELLLRDTSVSFRNREEAEKALDTVLNGITSGLRRNPRAVTITGFGTFRAVKRTARSGVDPNSGETITIPPSTTIKFKVSEVLQRRL